MTRDEKVNLLVACDIRSIRNDMYDNDFSYLESILRGAGWVQYVDLTDEEVDEEFEARSCDWDENDIQALRDFSKDVLSLS